MSTQTPSTRRLRAALLDHRTELAKVLAEYGAVNPRVFGSVARGDAREDSDIDLLVDLLPDRGNELMRVSGASEDLSALLGVRVDVVAMDLLRREVSETVLADAEAV